MPFSIEQTAAPQSEPLTTSEAKSHLRVDVSDDDSLIDDLVAAARIYVERITNRSLITQTWKYYRDGHFPLVIRLPRGPVQSITSIEYFDTQGNSQTVTSSVYKLDNKSEPARVVEEDGEDWPDTEGVINDIIITYDAGYGDNASDVPQPIRQAMLMLVGHWYENREQVSINASPSMMPMAVDALLAPYRVFFTGEIANERRQA